MLEQVWIVMMNEYVSFYKKRLALTETFSLLKYITVFEIKFNMKTVRSKILVAMLAITVLSSFINVILAAAGDESMY